MKNILHKIKVSYFKSLKGENFWINFWLWTILSYHGFFLISAFCSIVFDLSIQKKTPDILVVSIILFLFFNFPYLLQSIKNVLGGKEKLWKVFWLWVVVLYFGDIFLTVYALFKINYGYIFPILLGIYKGYKINLLILYSVIYINFILVPFLALITKRNFENLEIKNSCLRKITLFIPFILVFLMCMTGFGFIFLNFAFATGNYLILVIISFILPLWFYGKIFRNFYHNLKY